MPSGCLHKLLARPSQGHFPHLLPTQGISPSRAGILYSPGERLQPHPTLTQSLLMMVTLLLRKLIPLSRLTSMKISLSTEWADSDHQPRLYLVQTITHSSPNCNDFEYQALGSSKNRQQGKERSSLSTEVNFCGKS